MTNKDFQANVAEGLSLPSFFESRGVLQYALTRSQQSGTLKLV
jgi:hypothetical protein